MAKRHRRYTEEYKRQIVALYEGSDRSAASLEREYELSRGSVWRWTKQYGTEPNADSVDGGKSQGFPREVRSAEAEQIRKLERENEILRQERDILKKSNRHLLASQTDRYAFIERYRKRWPVTRMCYVLDVSRSGYYTWRKHIVGVREMANRRIVAEIEEIFEETDHTYGSPRMTKALRARGYTCSENRVARLMRENHIRVKPV